jgi:lysophospholipase L1-like esterase
MGFGWAGPESGQNRRDGSFLCEGGNGVEITVAYRTQGQSPKFTRFAASARNLSRLRCSRPPVTWNEFGQHWADRVLTLDASYPRSAVPPETVLRRLKARHHSANVLYSNVKLVDPLYVENFMISAERPPQPNEPSRAIGEQPCIVACLGSSSTAGKGQAFNWIAELRRRLGQRRFIFRNFGVGGDLAYNALQRLSAVIASDPKKVVVFIGGNDVLALVSTKARRFFRVSKRLPCDPSPDWFHENLQAIVRRLKAETLSSIAVCSLPPIGEEPASAHAFQRELNRRIEEFSAIIRGTAQQEGVDYIALYEEILAQIMKSPGRPLTEFRFLPFYRDAFRVLALRKSPDEVARINGWRFHTDGVHLNSRGGLVVADLVQKFVER